MSGFKDITSQVMVATLCYYRGNFLVPGSCPDGAHGAHRETCGGDARWIHLGSLHKKRQAGSCILHFSKSQGYSSRWLTAHTAVDLQNAVTVRHQKSDGRQIGAQGAM